MCLIHFLVFLGVCLPFCAPATPFKESFRELRSMMLYN